MSARKYFGTDGIRGRVGEGPISADFVLRLGNAYGHALTAAAPVSYTHLDVYKRQGDKNISLAALFASARFNAHVFLANVKPIAAAEERAAFLDYMSTCLLYTSRCV